MQNYKNEILKEENNFSVVTIYLSRAEILLLNNDFYSNIYSDWFNNEFEQTILPMARNNNLGEKIKLGFYSNTFSRLQFDVLFKYQTLFSEINNSELLILYNCYIWYLCITFSC